jgi:hypothetical protein
MRCRLTKTGMILALLLSAWGNVFAASLCPRMEQGHACCRARRASLPECHKGMTDMRAGHALGEAASEQESDAESISRPSESCAHCMGHSQLPSSPALLREAGQVNLGSNLHLTLKPAEPGSFAAALTRIVAAREHSPPEANTSARHVLINVFRI